MNLEAADKRDGFGNDRSTRIGRGNRDSRGTGSGFHPHHHGPGGRPLALFIGHHQDCPEHSLSEKDGQFFAVPRPQRFNVFEMIRSGPRQSGFFEFVTRCDPAPPLAALR